jgi:ketosteroid isomerase-like protein
MSIHKLFFRPISFVMLAALLQLTFMSEATAAATTQLNKDVTQTPLQAEEQAIIQLSKQKWLWMADRNIDALESLFHEKAQFVHMGGTMDRAQELSVIKSGGIHYKKADIHDVSVNVMGDTAIVLNKITLLAVVGGKEVTNPFVVTEVYLKHHNQWALATLSFTRLLTP